MKSLLRAVMVSWLLALTHCDGTITPVGWQAADLDSSISVTGPPQRDGGDGEVPVLCMNSEECPPGQWCNREPMVDWLTCMNRDKFGYCEPRPTLHECPAYETCPVACGCDGNPFCDACRAHVAGVSVTQNGAWCIRAPASKMSCAINGHCEDNEMCLRAGASACSGGVEVSGICIAKPTLSSCLGLRVRTSADVCGCDAHWYRGQCMANIMGVNVSLSSDLCEAKEICYDGEDNDGDGLSDALDSDCKEDPFCCPSAEICNDSKDNDLDQQTDCSDSDCKGSSDCPGTEKCDDKVDNDGDGLTDCSDPSCVGTAFCVAAEVCDGVDNDVDGVIDEGNVCNGVPDGACLPGSIQSCDCYCGVHRKCAMDHTWGPCIVDYYPGYGGNDQRCFRAEITAQNQCQAPMVCDYGKCIDYTGTVAEPQGECVHHSDCPVGKICDLGACKVDSYTPDCE